MKIENIYVGGVLALSSGQNVVAVYPAQKGDKCSYLLMVDGRVAKLDGARINRLSPANYLKANGWVLADADNAEAKLLADELEIRDGLKLVDVASQAQARVLTARHAEQRVTLVPFDPEQPIVEATVAPSRGGWSACFHMDIGISSAMIDLEFDVTRKVFTSSYDLGRGWLVPAGVDPKAMPRLTDYGGPLEQAVFYMVASGLGHLNGKQNLEMLQECDMADPFCRGKLELVLETGDSLVVGVDGADELLVHYVRQGEVIYQRSGVANVRYAPRVGDFVGAIAAALVHVQDQDAAAAKRKPKKKAA